MKNREIIPINYSSLFDKIAVILQEARTKVVREINKAQVLAYWEIRREIVEFEQKGKERAEYGEELLIKLSADLSAKFGRGFSRSNLQNMRLLYLAYPQKCQTVSGKSLKSETVSRKLIIRQTLSDESQKKQTASAKFESLLSSPYYEVLENEQSI